jgi:hypothetical protein
MQFYDRDNVLFVREAVLLHVRCTECDAPVGMPCHSERNGEDVQRIKPHGVRIMAGRAAPAPARLVPFTRTLTLHERDILQARANKRRSKTREIETIRQRTNKK